ncbi:RidA family protein [Govanella unica]|uniref:RidA family protein n=1 Tax=Govanella unica TaxID=2975056 RepID=A0A9X3TWQ8_9PROT|nr:RidA family protein [Govania unica]MDA5193107.1 RidA family protein [Govania unica]
MSTSPEARLAALGITLPVLPAPVANYVPVVQSGNLLFVSGQLPFVDGKVAVTGKLGGNVSEEEGIHAARLCAINLLAQVKAVTGDLAKVTRVVRLGGFVASTPDFTGQPKIANGASDLLVEVFGDAGRHARTAAGTNVLPLDAAVEFDAIFEIA